MLHIIRVSLKFLTYLLFLFMNLESSRFFFQDGFLVVSNLGRSKFSGFSIFSWFFYSLVDKKSEPEIKIVVHLK